MTTRKNILPEEDALKDDALLRYLEGKATDEERFAIEDEMADAAFLNDAVEGLQAFRDPGQLKQYAAQLNLQLKKQTAKNKKRKDRRKLKTEQWALIAVVSILLLCLLSYYIIRLLHPSAISYLQ
jgi:hypothetical protein